MFETNQKKGSKPPRGRANMHQRISFQESIKEFLRQIFGLMRGASAAADEGVQWVPVIRTQPGQCFLGGGLGIRLSCQDDTPMSRAKGHSPCDSFTVRREMRGHEQRFAASSRIVKPRSVRLSGCFAPCARKVRLLTATTHEPFARALAASLGWVQAHPSRSPALGRPDRAACRHH